MKRGAALLLLFLMLRPLTVLAIGPDEMLADPALEARARSISKELRCLVCQSESIDESEAELAKDLRRIVRERLQAGDSDQAVVGYVTARYGDFVLMTPPVKPSTLPLWLAPVLVLGLGGSIIAVAFLRRRTKAETPLSAVEEAALAQALERMSDGQQKP
jgi:cytochrome c-type biogenesis protein CcmH